MKAAESSAREKPQSPLCLPDLPLPTPPPMANIMVTSRFDLQTRGGCGYRRILSSRSTDFGRSPVLSRAAFGRSFYGSLAENLGGSPLPRHRTFEDSPLEDRGRSKYLSKDSVLSQEFEEVSSLARELRNKFGDFSQSGEASPEYQNVFFNEHYMSDIDENEEIKQFSFGYKTPERRLSDGTERSLQGVGKQGSYNTLPSLSSFRQYKSSPGCCGQQDNVHGSLSSMKSSDFCSPPAGRRAEFGGEPSKVMKPPQRPVVKIAKIRLVVGNFRHVRY
ncbi:hypothetical protein BDFB_008152 [Asbolus verrucosus]|uniref:Uncharacterized protein n=1 Tax=Asbolus verrucosus TaxID=1661398 RepID=A0A482WCJ3_ASBVE|nr:hypothetical protein BDFB_008152 [Asbolus verrucosus]